MATNTPPPELAKFPVGSKVADRYEVLEHVGDGGMGFVVRAKDLTLDSETVALKILYPKFVKDDVIFARFRREVLLTRKLSHPNIVKIFDLGAAAGETYFISMEFVEGESLSAKLKKTPGGLPMNDVFYYLYRAALALAYAHSMGVVHRDIKPGNILITSKSEVKLTDLGVARSIESTEKLTQTNEALGSPHYMSPEQLNAKAVDQRTDIYSLGIMGYELATGRPPFEGEHWMALVTKHLTEPMPDFASKARGIPFWYEELIHRAASKEPADRFQTAEEFAKFIAKHADVKGRDTVGFAYSGIADSGGSRKRSGLLAWLHSFHR